MRKISVYLTEQDAEQLWMLALRDGRSQAELIREGVRRVIADAEPEPRRYRSLGAGHGGGQPYAPWRPGSLSHEAMGER